MTISVSILETADRADWEVLYHGYAEFYQVPMNDQILDTVWGWIHDDSNPFFGLVAKDENGKALGLMHCRQMASPLRGALVGFLDDLFVSPDARGLGVVEIRWRLRAAGRDCAGLRCVADNRCARRRVVGWARRWVPPAGAPLRMSQGARGAGASVSREIFCANFLCRSAGGGW